MSRASSEFISATRHSITHPSYTPYSELPALNVAPQSIPPQSIPPLSIPPMSILTCSPVKFFESYFKTVRRQFHGLTTNVTSLVAMPKEVFIRDATGSITMFYWDESVPDTMPGKFFIGSGTGSTNLLHWRKSIEKSKESGGEKGMDIQCMCASHDAKFLITGAKDGYLRRWLTADLSVWDIFDQNHRSPISAVCVMHKNDMCVSSSADGVIYLMNIESLTCDRKVSSAAWEVNTLSISMDDRLLLSGSTSEELKIWDLSKYSIDTHISQLQDNQGIFLPILADPENESTPKEYSVISWSTNNLSESRFVEIEFTHHRMSASGEKISAQSRNVMFSSASNFPQITANQSYLFVAYDRLITVLCIVDLSTIATLKQHSQAINNLSISSDGLWLASASKDNKVVMWDLSEDEAVQVKQIEVNCTDFIKITPDESVIVTINRKGMIEIWHCSNVKTCTPVEIKNLTDITAAVISPNSMFLACGDVSGDIATVNLTTLQQRIFDNSFNNATISALEFISDNSLLSASVHLTLWNVSQGQLVKSIDLSNAANRFQIVNSKASGKSKVIVTAINGDIYLYELPELAYVQRLNFEPILASITPKGKLLVTTSDRKIRLKTLPDDPGLPDDTCLAEHTFSDDPHTIIINSSDLQQSNDDYAIVELTESVKILDLEDLTIVASVELREYPVYSIQLSLFGTEFAVVCKHSVTLWSLNELCELEHCTCEDETIIAVSPNFKFFISRDSGALYRIHYFSSSQSDFFATPSLFFAENLREISNGLILNPRIYSQGPFNPGYNILHVSAAYDQADACRKYLDSGVPIIRGREIGSPITVALRENARLSLDEFLKYLIEQSKDPRNWRQFEAVAEDIPDLLGKNLASIADFMKVLLCPYSLHGTNPYISPNTFLPQWMVAELIQVVFSTCRHVRPKDFKSRDRSGDEVFVEYHMSLVRWNFTSGSESSLRILRALEYCADTKVLATPWASAVVMKKWKIFFPLTITFTVTYCFMLAILQTIQFNYSSSSALPAVFLVLNLLLMVKDVMGVLELRARLINKCMNIVGLLRVIFSVMWALTRLAGYMIYSLEFWVIALCYLQGFIYFRSFKGTRVFVHMVVMVVRKTFMFLIIVAYSTYAFAMVTAVYAEDAKTVGHSWTSAFEVLMGNPSDNNRGLMQWAILTVASILNVIVLLNLLISILGDAYQQAQLTAQEHDVRQMLGLIIEYESMLWWKRKRQGKTVMVKCQYGNEGKQNTQIKRRFEDKLKDAIAPLVDKLSALERKVSEIDEKNEGSQERQKQERLEGDEYLSKD